MKTYFLCI